MCRGIKTQIQSRGASVVFVDQAAEQIATANVWMTHKRRGLVFRHRCSPKPCHIPLTPQMTRTSPEGDKARWPVPLTMLAVSQAVPLLRHTPRRGRRKQLLPLRLGSEGPRIDRRTGDPGRQRQPLRVGSLRGHGLLQARRHRTEAPGRICAGPSCDLRVAELALGLQDRVLSETYLVCESPHFWCCLVYVGCDRVPAACLASRRG